MTDTRPTFRATEHLPECDLPVVHLNGTGRDTLLREYHEALQALDKFSSTFGATTCNGRDYYPLGDEAYSKARRTRDTIYVLLDEISAFLDDHLAHLSK